MEPEREECLPLSFALCPAHLSQRKVWPVARTAATKLCLPIRHRRLVSLPPGSRKKKIIELISTQGSKEKTNIDRGAASDHVVRIIKVQRYLGHRGCVKEGKPIKLSNCPTIGRSQPSRKTGQLFKHETCCCCCCLGWLRGKRTRRRGERRPCSEKQTGVDSLRGERADKQAFERLN